MFVKVAEAKIDIHRHSRKEMDLTEMGFACLNYICLAFVI
jgi:hypothetical protein